MVRLPSPPGTQVGIVEFTLAINKGFGCVIVTTVLAGQFPPSAALIV
jgi:hypothetical protein